MTDVFKLLTYLINNNGYWATIIFVGLVSIIFITWGYIILSQSSIGKIIDKQFSDKLKKEKEAHSHGNRLRKQFDKDVDEILQDLAEETGANRAIVFEFSNGTTNLIGLPFLYMTIVAEVANPGLPLISRMHQRINTSIISKFLVKLEKEGSIVISPNKPEIQEFKLLRQIMTSAKITSSIFCSIQGIEEAIGFIALIFDEDSSEILDLDRALLLTNKAGQKIGSRINFDEITEIENKRKKTKWFFK